jgi:hypothetical protein
MQAQGNFICLTNSQKINRPAGFDSNINKEISQNTKYGEVKSQPNSK